MTIWDRIRAALEPKNTVPSEVEHQLRLATGALLLEMCRADFKVMPAELESIARSIKTAFELSAEETRELVRAAETESACAVSLQIYTSLIQEHSTQEQKTRLIVDLWHAAYADGELHSLEENLIERVASLIGIPPKTVRQIRRRIDNDADGEPSLSIT